MIEQPAGMMRVSTSYATFGLLVKDGRIIEAAPIARWCIGRDARDMWRYWAQGRRAVVSWTPDKPVTDG